MERLDDERALARVTYLPGVQPPENPLRQQESSSRSGLGLQRLRAEDLSVDGPSSVLASDAGDSVQEPVAEEAVRSQVGASHHVSISALARRGMSRREMERHLRDREFDEEEIVDEIERLERDGYLDDVALAQNLVGTLQERKGLGRSGIAAELTRRLLAPAAIEYALDLIDTGDELSRAREIALKRAGQLRGLDRETAVRRLSAYLARRGYGGSTIRAAVDQALPATTRRGVAFH